jgi:perosamine synthetase
LYRCLDRILPHKTKLEQHLKRRYGELFGADFDVLLYDLTSTYVEGAAEKNPMMAGDIRAIIGQIVNRTVREDIMFANSVCLESTTMTDDSYIPFHRPSIGEEEMNAVQQVLASGWLTTGPVAIEFEKQFATYIGCKHALTVNSCTSALQLALDAIRLQVGDEVLVPSYTFTATAEVVTYFGARPVLCDSVAGGFNVDPADAERRITARTRAIIPVHIAGEPCDMDRVSRLAHHHNLHVIEDAAHALPASYRGRQIGTISKLTAFSFYATKTITTGEGGMLTTEDDNYAERISIMRLHGIGRDTRKRYGRTGSWFYEVREAGFKMNLPDLLAALGVAQLKKANDFWHRRRLIAATYQKKLAELDELELPPGDTTDVKHSWHLFILRLRSEFLNITRNEFIEELNTLGIGASVHFIPLHRHPFYVREYGCIPSDFPRAEDNYSRCVSLPIYPDMSEAQCERVVRSVIHVIEKGRKKTMVAVS